MPMPTKKSTLGRSIIRSRFGGHRIHDDDTTLILPGQFDHGTNLASVTQENDLDSFLRTAEMAETEFTAERKNVEIINSRGPTAYQLSAEKEREMLSKISANTSKLVIPRRPKWDAETTPVELKRLENNSFLEWRKSLAYLEEELGMVMTPFERNLEVWRQLWRVIERSDVLVQIVDGRNPLFFHCKDVEKYVKEVDPNKENFLLINKADFLSEQQREYWADHFRRENIKFGFFSALLEDEVSVVESEEEDQDQDETEHAAETQDHQTSPTASESMGNMTLEEPVEPVTHSTTTVLSPKQFLSLMPRGKTIGLVGYPNVGKSSTINKLISEKKVTVSSTPGKTKHFQTIHLDDMILCDCPGLVFPSFAVTKAEMVVNGVLPIDQMRDAAAPSQLVANRIPRYYLEWIYGITIALPIEGEDPNRPPTGPELLVAYARARGFMRAGQGTPDESRAARYILKDYVNGKLLFCHPPPNVSVTLYNNQYDEGGVKHTEAQEAREQEIVKIDKRESTELPIADAKEVAVHVKVIGKGQTAHLTRPMFPYQSDAGSMSGASLTGGKASKKHKKAPRSKARDWQV